MNTITTKVTTPKSTTRTGARVSPSYSVTGDYQNRRKDFGEAFLDHPVNWEFAASQLK